LHTALSKRIRTAHDYEASRALRGELRARASTRVGDLRWPSEERDLERGSTEVLERDADLGALLGDAKRPPERADLHRLEEQGKPLHVDEVSVRRCLLARERAEAVQEGVRLHGAEQDLLDVEVEDAEGDPAHAALGHCVE